MITIFCDFWQFSAKKLAFFLNTNVMIKFCQNLALFWVNNAYFPHIFFGKNIFKIITSVPGKSSLNNITWTKQRKSTPRRDSNLGSYWFLPSLTRKSWRSRTINLFARRTLGNLASCSCVSPTWNRGQGQSCHIFLGTNIPKREKYTKWPQTLPNGRKLYQMAMKYSKWS
jgi:hypothetical protein